MRVDEDVRNAPGSKSVDVTRKGKCSFRKGPGLEKREPWGSRHSAHPPQKARQGGAPVEAANRGATRERCCGPILPDRWTGEGAVATCFVPSKRGFLLVPLRSATQ